MKRIVAFLCILTITSVMLMTGCTNTKSPDEYTVQPETVAPVMPDENGKISKDLLDEDNVYEQYEDNAPDQQCPITRYECEDDGTVISGDIFEYDENRNETKRTHYEGKTLDYTEVREYDEKNQNTKIVTYAGEVKRENLISSCVLEYDENGNEIKSATYDSDNTLVYYDVSTYDLIGDDYSITSCTNYDSDDNITEKTEYSYRENGVESKEIRTVYNGKEVKYYCQTAYDMDGNMVSYNYFDKNNKKIPEPQEEKDAYE